jgi:hypothetical protein
MSENLKWKIEYSTRWPRGYLQMDPRGYDLVYLARLEERMKGRGFVSP